MWPLCPIFWERHVLFDLVIDIAHVLPRMTHPELVQALRTPHVFPQVGVPKTTERMVPSFVRSGERIYVLQLLQRLVQMTPDDVRG